MRPKNGKRAATASNSKQQHRKGVARHLHHGGHSGSRGQHHHCVRPQALARAQGVQGAATKVQAAAAQSHATHVGGPELRHCPQDTGHGTLCVHVHLQKGTGQTRDGGGLSEAKDVHQHTSHRRAPWARRVVACIMHAKLHGPEKRRFRAMVATARISSCVVVSVHRVSNQCRGRGLRG